MGQAQDEQHLIGHDGKVLDASDDVEEGALGFSDDVEEDPKERSVLFSSIEQSKEIAVSCFKNKKYVSNLFQFF